MPKREIVRVMDDAEPGEAGYLSYHDAYQQEGPVGDTTLEELADMCDQKAESRNNHAYVGTHRILAALLLARLGRHAATLLLREIAEYGGLDGMSGAGGQPSAFADFGILDCWAEWALPDEEQQS